MNEAALNRCRGGLRPVPNAQLAENILHMVLGGGFGDIQPVRDQPAER
jgi:hypothetical protein